MGRLIIIDDDPPPAEVAYVAAVDSGTTNSTSHSLSIGIGDTATADELARLVIIAVYMLSASVTAVTSATIGGVSATIGSAASVNDSTGRYTVCFIWAYVPTGTSATVAVSLSSAALIRFRSFRAVKLLSETPVDQATNADDTVRSIAASIDVARDGIALGIGSGFEPSVTWVITGVTEDYSVNVWNAGGREVGGSIETSIDETARVIEVSYSGGSTNAMCVAAISFR